VVRRGTPTSIRARRRGPEAGTDYADPDYDLSVDWIAASVAIKDTARRHAHAAVPTRILLINGSSRSEHTQNKRHTQNKSPGGCTGAFYADATTDSTQTLLLLNADATDHVRDKT
jgi:hypothetical protein